MKKRLLSMLLAVSMVLSLISVPVMATEPEIQASGTCGENLTWTLTTDGTLSINGVGYMNSFLSVRPSWYEQREDISEVYIEAGVASIGEYAFQYCSNLKSIEIPSSVSYIGIGAFYNCSSLVDVKIPDSVTSINGNTFRYCSSLNAVEIPLSVHTIDDYAFASCISLSNVVLPAYLESIGHRAFAGCKSLRNVVIPERVQNIGTGAFSSCSDLQQVAVSENNIFFISIDGVLFDINMNSLIQYPVGREAQKYEIPIGVKSIGEFAFLNCDYLVEVTVPASVISIEYGAFRECDNLDSIQLKGIQNIGEEAFLHCDKLGTVELGTDVKNIGIRAFSTCSILKKVHIAGKDVFIKDWAFYDCDSLESIELGDGVTDIGAWAFSYNEKLKNVTISDTVKNIREYAFRDCVGLTDVYYEGTKEQWDECITVYMWNEWLTSATIHFNSGDFKEDYIIQAVKSYTTEEFFAQWSEITMSNDSNEALLQRMTELFMKHGFLDVNEGVKYLSNTQENRAAYRMLTTDGVYCAQNYFDWLHNSKKGLAARGLLVADGLIFNFEFSEWLDLSNFAEANYPGVQKYKDMLYDYMEVESFKIEQMRYISHVTKMASKCTSAGKLYAENLIQKLNQCSTRTDLRNAMISSSEAKGFYLDIKISGTNVDDFKISYEYVLDETCGFGKYAKAIGYAAKTISIANMGVNHVVDIIELDSKLEILSHYETFLQEISGAKDLPLEMRLAAQGILRELEEGAWKKVKDIAYDIFELALDANQSLIKFNFQDTVVEKALGKVGAKTVSEFMAVIGVTSFCINQIADIGSLVKGVAYVEGYVYLQNHYKQKLIDSREAFLANQTAENAWKFFEYYNVLYQLRYKGEEAYLNMSKIKGISSYFYDYGYAMKEEVVQETLFGLATRCQFGLSDEVEIPESVQYVTKAVIDCPVDVAIYAPNGTHIVTLEDGIESDLTNEHGRFAVVYRPYSGEYAKVVCFNQQGNYQIQITGIDDGLLDFEMATTDGEKVTNYRFDHLVIQEGTVLDASTEELIEAQCYLIDQDGDGEFEEYGNISVVDSTSYSAVEELKLNRESVELSIGESCVLSVGIAPEDASRKDVIWMSSNPEVATISNGRVEAIASGEAIVYCVSQDNCEVSASCRVTVATVGIKDVCRIQKKDGVYAECAIEHLQDSANLIFAFYDSNNRFCQICQEPAVNGTTTVKIPDGAVTVSVFLLDEDWKPLTEKQSLSLEKTG